MRAWSLWSCVSLAGLAMVACSDDSAVARPAAMTATVLIAYSAPTQPSLPASVQDCVRGVGATHVHPSWRGFVAVTMRIAAADRFELSLDDVPVNQRVSIRVSDANACLENPTGAATRNVSANGIRLTDIVTTPGSGPEPGLAFTVAADGRVTP
jgi:hypothetical protein